MASGLSRLLKDPLDIPADKLETDWEEVQQALFGFEEKIQVQHVSSHRETNAGIQDFDDWTAHWNGRADHEAIVAHQIRMPELKALQKQMIAHHRQQLVYMKELVALHLDTAQTSFDACDEDHEDRDDEVGPDLNINDQSRTCAFLDPWQSNLPSDPYAVARRSDRREIWN